MKVKLPISGGTANFIVMCSTDGCEKAPVYMETRSVDEDWNSHDHRPLWSDPYGELISTKKCGCREYRLGRGFCLHHFILILKGGKIEVDINDLGEAKG